MNAGDKVIVSKEFYTTVVSEGRKGYTLYTPSIISKVSLPYPISYPISYTILSLDRGNTPILVIEQVNIGHIRKAEFTDEIQYQQEYMTIIDLYVKQKGKYGTWR